MKDEEYKKLRQQIKEEHNKRVLEFVFNRIKEYQRTHNIEEESNPHTPEETEDNVIPFRQNQRKTK